MFAAQGVDIDAPRAKRHKGPNAATSSSPQGKTKPQADVIMEDSTLPLKKEAEEVNMIAEDREMVKDKGLKLWHTVKDAVNKECVMTSSFRSSAFSNTLTSDAHSLLCISPTNTTHNYQRPTPHLQRPSIVCGLHTLTIQTTIS